jgi:hypothetical protein
MTSGLNPAVQIPGDGVLDTGFDADYTHGTYPDLASLGILPGGLLNLKLDSAL